MKVQNDWIYGTNQLQFYNYSLNDESFIFVTAQKFLKSKII